MQVPMPGPLQREQILGIHLLQHAGQAGVGAVHHSLLQGAVQVTDPHAFPHAEGNGTGSRGAASQRPLQVRVVAPRTAALVRSLFIF